MFTGIIKNLGEVVAVSNTDSGLQLQIKVDSLLYDSADYGDSISVNGCCLTVTDKSDDVLYFDVIHETLKLTNVSCLAVGDTVNLEPSLTLNSLIGGHLLNGHVDFCSAITQIDGQRWSFSYPQEFDKYISLKGSIAVNGISLTVTNVKDGVFSVDLIPTTISDTCLKNLKVGDKVNFEIDLIARYLDKLSS